MACNARSTIRWYPSSIKFSPSPFAAIPNFIGEPVVFLPVSGCCNLVDDDDVVQRNEKLIVRHRRSMESEVQQALKHQFLDCEHLFLITHCAESLFVSLMNVLRMSSSCSASLALRAELLSDMFLWSYLLTIASQLCGLDGWMPSHQKGTG